MERFEGRVAVITGAGSGIGLATAEELARLGCSLALVDVDEARLREAASGLADRAAKVTTHTADVSDAERMAALPAEVVTEHGGVHILVNNAGVAVLGEFEEQSLDAWHWIVGVNFWGVVHGCRFFLPELRKADEAHIVNVSSIFGFFGLPTQSSYCATKFAVRGLSEALYAELADTPIGVTIVHPGGIQTNIVKDARAYDEDARRETIAGFERFAHPPQDVARAIAGAIRKRKLRVRVGREAYVLEWLKRLFPVGFHRLAAARWKRQRRRATPGSH